MPRRVVVTKTLELPGDPVYGEFMAGSGTQEASTTMAFAKLLRNLLRDKELGDRIVPIIPDEARTFGMDPLFKEVGIYSALGQLYDPVDSNLVLQLPRGAGRPGARGRHHGGRLVGLVPGRRHVLRDPRRADDPVLHLLFDVRLPAHRATSSGPSATRAAAASCLGPRPGGRRSTAKGCSTRMATRSSSPRPSRTSACTTRPSPTRRPRSCATASSACTAQIPRTSSTT